MEAIKQQERIYQERLYKSSEIIAFRKTAEAFGGLSNMAPGYPIKVNGRIIFNTEALYQACRFPHIPELQERILKERSPMTAKMIGKPFRSQSRPDFERVKIDIMRWCLRIKLAQNFLNFGKLLESTGNLPIVEDSHKDAFWGAMHDKVEPNILKGVNALGRLLMELRHQYVENRYSNAIFKIQPLQIPDFKLLGYQIEIIDERLTFLDYVAKQFCIENEQKIVRTNKFHQNIVSQSDTLILQKKEPELILSSPVKKTVTRKAISNKPDLEEKPTKKVAPKARKVSPLPLFNS